MGAELLRTHAEVAALRDEIHSTVSAYLYERTKRRPMVIPVLMQL